MDEFCQKPDRDVPGIICGHPLPCPYHTVPLPLRQLPVGVESMKSAVVAELDRLIEEQE